MARNIITERILREMVRCASLSALLLLLPANSWAAPMSARVPVTGMRVIAEGAAKEVSEEGKTPLVLGQRQNIVVRFKLPDGVVGKEVPKQENRIGLFLIREREAIASVQRGTLQKCETGFCSAVFQSNESFQFFAEEMKNPNRWFVQLLQNPVLEERLIEVDGSDEDSGIFGISSAFAELNYGRQTIVLEEKTTTPFNRAKVSRRTSWGDLFRIQASLDRWEVQFSMFAARLATENFFEDAKVSEVIEQEMGGAYTFLPWDALLLGLGAGKENFTFSTTNDDEGILTTSYNAWYVSGLTRYRLPWDIFTLGGGAFAMSFGDGLLSLKKGLGGSAQDTGEYRRGTQGSWKFLRFDYEHVFSFRAKSAWFDKLKLGFGYQMQNNSDIFTGAASGPMGPSGLLPSGTTSSGKQSSFKFFIGREFILK